MIDRELLKQYAEKYRYNIEEVEAEIGSLINGLMRFGVPENFVLELIEKGMMRILNNKNRSDV